MNIFPTRYSTLAAPALATFIRQQFGFEAVNCRFQFRNVSDTYAVNTTAGKFILKVFRNTHRSQEEIMGEIALLQHLHQKGIRVAVPVPDLTGACLQTFNAAEGIRHGVLYEFAPGSPIIEQLDEQVVLSGEYLANLHLHTQQLKLDHNRKAYTLDTLLHQPLQAVAPAFEEFGYTEGYNWLKKTATACEEKLQQLDTSQFSMGYCHYDFMPKNWHHDDQGAITLFDFDFSGAGWLVNDIASYAVYLTLLNPGKEEIGRRLNLFIQSYSNIRPLHPKELEALPQLGFLFWLFYLQYQYENFEDHTNVFFGPRYLRERIKLMEQYVELILPASPFSGT